MTGTGFAAKEVCTWEVFYDGNRPKADIESKSSSDVSESKSLSISTRPAQVNCGYQGAFPRMVPIIAGQKVHNFMEFIRYLCWSCFILNSGISL